MKVTNKTLQAVAKKYKILYVEDDLLLQKTTSEFFSNFFEEVVITSDGAEALKAYNDFYEKEKKYFDIVITDIQMPNMDGIELSREIIQKNKDQKIIIVSAYNETEYFIELIRIGVSGFMQKPLTSAQMLEILYEICAELNEQSDETRYLDCGDDFRWDIQEKVLSRNEVIISLTSNEVLVLDLFSTNQGKIFTDIEIFNHINFTNYEKEFSSNAIKSLLKRLRKKIPQGLIQTYKNLGYSFKVQ